jgi:cytoskeleton protein RodZ
MTRGPSMNESARLGDGDTALIGPAVDNDGVTAGAILRQAREAAGLHVAALAVALKVPVRKVEALEEDRLDLLPDAVFTRALASSVCRTLKIDPQPVLERLPQTAAPRLVQDGDGLNAPFHAPSDGARLSWPNHLSKLLGALVLIFLPSMQQEDKIAGVSPPTATAGAAAESAAPSEAAAVQPIQPVSMTKLPAASQDSVPTLTGMAAPASVEASAPLATSATAPEPESAPPATPASPTGVLLFRTRGSSWVEVTDAKGTVAVRKILSTGESAAVSGVLPLQVTVGSVDVTDVQVRGKPFDLRAVSRDNVAHFEVR